MSASFDELKALYINKYDTYIVKQYYDLLRQYIYLEDYKLIIEQAEHAELSLSKYITKDKIRVKNTEKFINTIFISPKYDSYYDRRDIFNGELLEGFNGNLVMSGEPKIRYNFEQVTDNDLEKPRTIVTQQKNLWHYGGYGFPNHTLILLKGQLDLAYTLARADVDVAVGDFCSIDDYNTRYSYDLLMEKFSAEDDKFNKKYPRFASKFYQIDDESKARTFNLIYRYSLIYRKR